MYIEKMEKWRLLFIKELGLICIGGGYIGKKEKKMETYI